MSRTVPTRVSFLLFFLFFLGLMLNVLAFVDLHWIHRLLTHGEKAPAAGPVDVTQVEVSIETFLSSGKRPDRSCHEPAT